MTINGNFGKLLEINLSDKKISDYKIPENYLNQFIGGKGLGARLLWDFLPKGTDPYSPENPLLMLTGPLVGQTVMGSARYVVMCKSPLSKYVTEAYGGGYFPYALKGSGYDGLIFKGKSNEPVYLNLVDGNIELNDASQIWDKGVFDTDDYFREKFGKNVRTALIGQAGVNKVRFSAIITDRNRAAARGGPGAVMGSKMLKGVVARGNTKANLADEDKFKEINQIHRSNLLKDLKIRENFGTYGTSSAPEYMSKNGILPTRNFKIGTFEHNKLISGPYMEEIGLLVGRDTCAACTTFCKRKINGDYKGHKLTEDGSSLEYETLAGFGSMVLNKNIKLNGYANQLCNDFGLDTISTGGVIAFTMEAAENNLTNSIGVNLEWSNEDQIIASIEKIAHREGYGNELAEGVMRLSEKIGGKEFAMHCKGLEIAYHEPRGKIGLGLSYAVSPRGGSHMEGFHDTAIMRDNAAPQLGATVAMSRFDHINKAPIVINFENATSFTNNLILCAFDVQKTGSNENLNYLRQLTEAATGNEISYQDMLEIGSRSYNMLRMVAIREGLSKIDDDLPDRFKFESLHFEDNIENSISPEKLDYMLNQYYENRNWDESGMPTNSLISELSLPAL